MAFSSILRRSASMAVPLAGRLVAGQRLRHAAAVSSFIRHGSLLQQRNSAPAPENGFSGHRCYSASSDKKLLEVIESEIQCALESNEQDEALDAPDGFPFKILDNPGQSVVTLEREYQGENITVEVSMPDLSDAALDENDDDNDDDEEEKNPETTIPIVVRIAKKNGTLIEFACTVHPDDITIDALSMKDPKVSEEDLAYEGPDFADLDESLQKAFLKYLDTRGIKPSTIGFMHEYMINKDDKEYLNWLNELKSFVQA